MQNVAPHQRGKGRFYFLIRGDETMSGDSTGPSPCTFYEAMFIGFLCLRIAGAIDWSWYYIAAPLFVQMAIGLLIATGIFIFRKLAEQKGRN
jgi:hypothetical protein